MDLGGGQWGGRDPNAHSTLPETLIKGTFQRMTVCLRGISRNEGKMGDPERVKIKSSNPDSQRQNLLSSHTWILAYNIRVHLSERRHTSETRKTTDTKLSSGGWALGRTLTGKCQGGYGVWESARGG